MIRGPEPDGAPAIPTWRLTVALGTNQLLSWGTTFYLPAVITGTAARDLATTQAGILGAFSWSLLVTGICAPRVGKWIGRNGGRGTLAASTIVLAAGLAVLAAAPDLAGWYAGWTVLGAGMALGLYDAAFATAGTLLGPAVSPVITGVTLIAGFASTVGWPAGAELLRLLGWRGMLLAYAGVQLAVNLPLVVAMIPRGPVVQAQTEVSADHSSSRRERHAAIAGLAGFFTIRWFLTSAIATHVLHLMAGLGLTAREALAAAMLIGPGQVAGRLLEWVLAGRIGVLTRARLGALLFPAGALVLGFGGPASALIFAVLYGMSNGILTVNRGTLPMLVLGPQGYAALLGWLALPVLLAQAAAPPLSAPLVEALAANMVLLLAGGVAFGAALLLLPLRLWQPAGQGRVT
jgi:hypothetical protein